MADGITIDTRQFDRALRDYIKVSKSTVPEILNRKAYFILLGAMKGTPVVDASTMTREIGTPGRPKPLAFKIVNKKRRLRGDLGKTQEEVTREVSDMVRNRRRSRGVTRSGWVKAIRAFGKATGLFTRTRAKRIRQQSIGRIARKSTRIKARAAWSYILTHLDPTGRRMIPESAWKAFRESWRAETVSMKAETVKRLQKDADRFSVKKTSGVR